MRLRALATAAVLLATTAPTLTVSDAASAATPFNTIGGVWGGTGRVKLASGKSLTVRCRVYYNPKQGGARLGMAIRCAAPDNKIELRGQLAYNGGRVSGSWVERTYNAKGSLAGSARPGRISLNIRGGVSGALSISYSRRSQNISIRSTTTELRAVSISLSRR